MRLHPAGPLDHDGIRVPVRELREVSHGESVLDSPELFLRYLG